MALATSPSPGGGYVVEGFGANGTDAPDDGELARSIERVAAAVDRLECLEKRAATVEDHLDRLLFRLTGERPEADEASSVPALRS
jgi:hypothetical protein